jgi:Ser/Thr protein kinase RdoA (MazF antagonist)
MPTVLSFPAQARAEELASSLEGCKVLEVSFANGPPMPAIKGGCFQFATVFKAFGGQWNHARKVHVFYDWSAVAASLEAALRRQADGAEGSEQDKQWDQDSGLRVRAG